MYNLKILNEIESSKWDKDLVNCEYSNFFQSGEYLLSESGADKFPIFIYVTDEFGALKGQMGIIVHKSPLIYSANLLKIFAKIFSKLGNRITWVCGPIIHSNDKNSRIEILHAMIKSLDTISEKHNVILIDGYTPPQDVTIDEFYIDEFRKNNYNVTNFFTFVTDLSKSEEEIWSSLNKNAQRDVTRSQKRNISVRELGYEQLDQFFLISEKWAQTKGIVKSMPRLVKERYWDYYKKGVEKVFLAYEDDEMIASHRLGCFNRIAYSHSLINSYTKEGNLGGPVLTWHALQWAKKEEMRIYDFSGGEAAPIDANEFEKYDKQWNSLLSYKRKWGGEEFPYFHVVKVRKKFAYKVMRVLLKIDWRYRSFKKKKYENEYSS